MFERCPNCNHYLTQTIEYAYGNPTIHKYCKVCGWDSYNIRTYATTSTKILNLDIYTNTSTNSSNQNRYISCS